MTNNQQQLSANPPKRKRGGLIAALISVGVLLLASLVGLGLLLAPPAAANEIVLEAADAVGADPFSSDPFAGTPPVIPTATASTPAAASTPAPVQAVSAGTPGLYGGTQDVGSCDAAQLVSFLDSNPDKAAAWVGALNADPTLRWTGGALTPSDIGAYVASLTSLVLMADIRVTNHGFAGGQATPVQSVLQAGTAVLIDQFGTPRARCFCGNPLIPAETVPSTATFSGSPWPGFDPNKVVTLTGTPEAIRTLLTASPLNPTAPLTSTPLGGGAPTPTPTPTATPAPSATPSAPAPTPTQNPPASQAPVPPAPGTYCASAYAGGSLVRNTLVNNTSSVLDVFYYDEACQPVYTHSVNPGVQDSWIESDLPNTTFVVTSGTADILSSHVVDVGLTWVIP